MSITLIDADSERLTISWPNQATHGGYILQQRESSTKDGDNSYATVPFERLVDTHAVLRVLNRDVDYCFRVAAILEEPSSNKPPILGRWISNLKPFRLLSKEQQAHRMDAPKVFWGGTNRSAALAWKAPSSSSPASYDIQI